MWEDLFLRKHKNNTRTKHSDTKNSGENTVLHTYLFQDQQNKHSEHKYLP